MLAHPDWYRADLYDCVENAVSFALVQTVDRLLGNGDMMLVSLADFLDPLPVFDAPASSVNYKGDTVDKRPDFVFRRKFTPGLRRLNAGLVVEAKLITPSHPISDYCGKGLKRFVVGDYAWAETQSFMFGYVRNSHSLLPTTLAAHLAPAEKQKEYAIKKMPFPINGSVGKPRSHGTVHHRSWTIPDASSPTDDIEVRHLWLTI